MLAIRPLYLFGLLLCLPLTALLGQGDEVGLINGHRINPHRYEEYRGSPYQFTEWPRGNIITTKFHRFYDIALNFNGHTGEFEVRNKEEYIELDPGYYLRIEVPVAYADGVDTLIFQKGIMPGKPQQFHQLVFQGRNFLLLKKLFVTLETRTIANVGASIEEKSLYPNRATT